MILALFQNMGILEWLLLIAIAMIIFRRSLARPLGRAVGGAKAAAQGPPPGGEKQKAPQIHAHARYFRALDLPEGATREQIRDAYRELVKVWHPDRFAHDEKLKERATAKLKEINEAYEKLIGRPDER